jgi:hypothetical protein
MRAPSSVTLALVAAAGAMVTLVHADPWAPERAAVPMLSAQSVTRRLFTELAEGALSRATIELRTPAGTLRLAPDEDGLHRVWRDDAPLGFVDSEALSGLWSSLRMATTLRAVAAGGSPGALQGEIAVLLDGREQSVRIFGASSDGVGLYGVLPHEGDAAWVVEPELGAVLGQAAEGWLLRRMLPVEPADATALVWDGMTLARGADGLWRVTEGGPKLLLADQAVALRLGQALAAEVSPLLPRADAAKYGPFVARHRVTDAMGHVREVLSGGTCPGEPERVVIDRGPGLLGCVAKEALAAFPVADPDAGLVEPQLVPYAYGRVLAVEQVTPSGSRRLRRFGGGWVIEEAGALVEVSEPEVFRWYGALQAVAVELPAEPLVFAPQHRLVIETDAGQSLAIGCGPTGASGMACARDEGPGLRVIGALPELAFTRETFADRRLLSFEAGAVRGLELLPGPASDRVRQSVRLDLGVWRLDAPAHPDGVAVLDEVRLEAILAALQSLRAEGWTPVPPTASLRTLRVEGLRAGTGDTALAVDVYASTDPAQCVGHVPGQPQAARLAPETCVALLDDLLYDDPLRFWLGQARSAQLTADGGAAAMLRREGEAWSVESGETGLLAQLPGLAAFRSAGLRSGEPRGAAVLTAKIWRSGAAAVRVDLGPTIDGAPAWVRLVGQPWYYLAGEPARE